MLIKAQILAAKDHETARTSMEGALEKSEPLPQTTSTWSPHNPSLPQPTSADKLIDFPFTPTPPQHSPPTLATTTTHANRIGSPDRKVLKLDQYQEFVLKNPPNILRRLPQFMSPKSTARLRIPRRILLLLALIALLSACGRNNSDPQEERLQVIATVSPITNIVYNISGDHVALTGLVPAGTDSHTFELAPSDVVTLSQADIIFINGLHLEESTLRLAEANLKDGAEIVLLGEMVIEPDDYVFDFSFPKEAGSPNPHLWTDPIFALKYAEIVRDKLTARDPDNGGLYQENYDEFAIRIEALDAAIQTTTASIPEKNRLLLTYHDSFAYFAPRYGYTVLGAIQPSDFSEPSSQEIAELIDQLRTGGITAIFGSEVFPSRVIEQIGREAGVNFVSTLSDDDLPGNPGDPKHSYISMMVENLKTMASALGGDPTLMEGVDTGNVPGPDTSVRQ